MYAKVKSTRESLANYFSEVRHLLEDYIFQCCCESLQENQETYHVYNHIIMNLVQIYINSGRKLQQPHHGSHTLGYFLSLILFSAIRLANKFIDDDKHFSSTSAFASNLRDYDNDIQLMNQIEGEMFRLCDYNLFQMMIVGAFVFL